MCFIVFETGEGFTSKGSKLSTGESSLVSARNNVQNFVLISSQKRKSALEEIMEVSSSKKVVMLQN